MPGIDDGGLGLRLVTTKPVTVRADGLPHRIAVGGFATQAQLTLVAIPLKSPWVHLRARIVNTGATALLAGPVLIPFRVPRNMIEMFIFPAALMLFGALLVTLGGSAAPTSPHAARPSPSLVVPLVALIAVLLVFQLILRPGVVFS